MRKAFIQSLMEIAEKDERVLILTGDLGYLVLEEFIDKFPGRIFNMGVAEQNMVGVATGLAEAGFIPFVYSIVNFSTMRPYEIFRNGPVLHQLPVRLVGVGGGLEYVNNGATHYGLEDVAIMRVQNGLKVIVPADSQQTKTAILTTWNLPGPIYYRLGKDDNLIIPGLEGKFEIDSIQIIRHGKDVVFLTLGNIAVEALEAAKELTTLGIECTIAVVPCLNPGPQPELHTLLQQFRLALSVEAHYINGGLGSLIAEVIAENGLRTRLIRCGIRSIPDGITGSQKFLYNKYGISSESIVKQVIFELQKKRAGYAD